MRTPDRQWRVEIYRKPRTREYWYRLVNVATGSIVEPLTIAGVGGLLAEVGVDMAELVDDPDGPTPAANPGAA
jgi:hypothetical protein